MKNDVTNAAAIEWIAAAIRNEKAWAKLHAELIAKYGRGPLTSGIGNATHAPAIEKDMLRNMSRNCDLCLDISLEVWRAAGRRAHTWRRLRDETRKAQA